MRERALAVARSLVAVIGTLPFSVLAGLAIALFLPAPEDVRMALGFALTIPLWVTAMCLAFLDARVWRATLALVASSAALALSIGAQG